MSPTSGIYWVDMGFINNYNEPQLLLVILKYNADVASVFLWVIIVTTCNWCIKFPQAKLFHKTSSASNHNPPFFSIVREKSNEEA